MNELALFAGAGGGILGGKLLGWRTVCAVEWDAYARDVLVARQNDGCLDPFPIWDDVQTFDGRPWRGVVDVVSGGFPCQDISCAGKGAGIDGERSGTWQHMARIVGEVEPRFVFVENSPMLVGRGLARVLGDLAEMGYDAKWGVVGADDAGAPHKRKRIWILAYANAKRLSWGGIPEIKREILLHASGRSRRDEASSSRDGDEEAGKMANSECGGLQGGNEQRSRSSAVISSSDCRYSRGSEQREAWWPEPDVGRVAHGVAAGMDRLQCIGNGQVPAVVALAWEILKNAK